MKWLVGIISVIAILSVMGFVANTVTKDNNNEVVEVSGCPVEPYFDITVRNASVPSQTSGTATFEYGQDGKKIGTLTSGASGQKLKLGQKYDVLASEGQHLDILKKDVLITSCGANPLTFDMWRSFGTNITIYNSGGTALSDDDRGGATNQTSISAGTSRNMKMEISSLGDQSTDPLWLTVEIFNKTAVQDVRISPVSSGVSIEEKYKSLPGFASSENATTTNYVETFKISGLANNGAVNTLTITIEASGSFAIDQTAVYVTPYTEQPFANVDGTWTYGIEDSDSNVKYEDSATDFDFHIT